MTAPPALESFLRHLQAEGVPVGRRQRLRLAAALGRDAGGGPGDAGAGEAVVHRSAAEDGTLHHGNGAGTATGPSLATLLRLALVSTPEQAIVFQRVYGLWEARLAEWYRRERAARQLDALPDDVDADELGETKGEAPRVEPRLRRWHWWVAAALALGVALAAALCWWLEQRKTVVRTFDESPLSVVQPTAGGLATDWQVLPWTPMPETQGGWVPEIVVTSRDPFDLQPWLLGGAGVAALLALFFIWRRYRLAPWDARHGPTDLVPGGPRRRPLLPSSPAGPQLVDGDQVQTLQWALDRHVSEDDTRRLDVAATVARTARDAGRPSIVYERDSELRELWLWTDVRAADARVMAAFNEEISNALKRTGLAARHGTFKGVPEHIQWPEGEVFRPEDVEAYRRTALVAVCTDGVALRRLQHRQPDRLQQTLAGLAGWPGLVFVDFSERPGALAAWLQRYGIACVAPDQLAAHFAEPAGVEAAATPAPPAGALSTWAAGLALVPQPVGLETAQRLREDMGLPLEAHAFPYLLDLRLDADDAHSAALLADGDYFRVPEDARRELLNRQTLMELQPAGAGIDAHGRLSRAIEAWQRRFVDEAAARAERNELDPWQQTRAAYVLKLEEALLLLWREPHTASDQLRELPDALADDVRGRLAQFAPLDRGDPQRHILLPWRWDGDQADVAAGRSLDAASQRRLFDLGIGGVERPKIARPGRLKLAAATLGGLGVLLLARWLLAVLPGGGEVSVDESWTAWQNEGPPKGALGQVTADWPADDAERRLASLRQQGFVTRSEDITPGATVVAGTASGDIQSRTVRANDVLSLRWRWDDSLPCAVEEGTSRRLRCPAAEPPAVPPGVSCQTPAGAAEHPRCEAFQSVEAGSGGPPRVRLAVPDWPSQSLAAIVVPDGKDAEAQLLAHTLLNSGSADQVWLGPDAAERALQARAASDAQLQAWALPEEGAPIAELLRNAGRSGLWAVRTWTGVEAEAVVAAIEALRLPTAVQELDAPGEVVASSESDARLVNCGARVAVHGQSGLRFVWVCGGTVAMGSDSGDSDERPPHQRRLSGFWLAETELPENQFAAALAETSFPRCEDRQDFGERAAPEVARSLPQAHVDWCEARAYCESLGAGFDLPWEDEWEYAARASDAREFPWGAAEPDAQRAVFGGSDLADVGSLAAGRGPFGALDQAGNLWEWNRDCYDSGAYQRCVDNTTDDQIVDNCRQTVDSERCSGRVLRGGSFDFQSGILRSAIRYWNQPGDRDRSNGFRCVRRVSPSPRPVDPLTDPGAALPAASALPPS